MTVTNFPFFRELVILQFSLLTLASVYKYRIRACMYSLYSFTLLSIEGSVSI